MSRKKIQWLISYVKMFLLGYLIQMGLFKIDCHFRNLESMVRGPCTFMCPPLLGHIHGMHQNAHHAAADFCCGEFVHVGYQGERAMDQIQNFSFDELLVVIWAACGSVVQVGRRW